MKQSDLARLIKEFYKEWKRMYRSTPDLLDFAEWLEENDVAANKKERYELN